MIIYNYSKCPIRYYCHEEESLLPEFKNFKFVADILNDICELTITIQNNSSSNKLVDFVKTTEKYINEIITINKEVSKYCVNFYLPQ